MLFFPQVHSLLIERRPHVQVMPRMGQIHKHNITRVQMREIDVDKRRRDRLDIANGSMNSLTCMS